MYGFTHCIFWITGIKKIDPKSKPERIMQNEDNAEKVDAENYRCYDPNKKDENNNKK